MRRCAKEGCHKEAGNHMYYDTTLCEDHAYDDEISNTREDLDFKTFEENEKE